MFRDIIAAISTPAGTGGISIVRVSGEGAVALADRIFRGGPLSEKKSHTLTYGKITDPGTGRILDEVLVSVFLPPGTYTREEMVEINCHGGPVVTGEVLSLLLKYGARPAEPGEFTKRAFLNGRLDLSQAEAVIDLINAKTELQRAAGAARLSGGMKDKVSTLRNELLDLMALIEAEIDYPDEMADENVGSSVLDSAKSLLRDLDAFVARAGRGRIIREGISAVILGKPNVGKSSLLNRLLDEERAIVTDIPGTTRDTIEEYIDMDGIPLKLIDTAGVRETGDKAEQMGVERALAIAEGADLVLLTLDSGRPLDGDDKRILEFIKEKNKKAVVLINKWDLGLGFDESTLLEYCRAEDILRVSAKSDRDFEPLFQKIRELFLAGEVTVNDEILTGGVRQRAALERAAGAVSNAVSSLASGVPTDLAAIDLQTALDALGEITGDTASDDVIDRIFQNFCVGK